MKRSSRAVLSLGLAAGLVAACDARDDTVLTETERARVGATAERVVDELFAAMNAGDPDRALTLYASGDVLVQLACTEIRQGHGAVARIIRRWLADNPNPAIEHEITRTEVLGPAAAVVTARARRPDGTGLFWTFVLGRDPGDTWRIVHEHQSWAGCREPRFHPPGA